MKKKDCRTEKRSEKILDALSRNLDLPQDAIALNTGRQTVRICGCELTVVSMQNGQAVIKGVITSILL